MHYLEQVPNFADLLFQEKIDSLSEAGTSMILVAMTV